MIATDSVVTKDVPPYTIVGGSPARVIRPRFAAPPAEYSDISSALLRIRWWDWTEEQIHNAFPDFMDPRRFIEKYDTF